MKKIHIFLSIIITGLVITSCKKETAAPSIVGSLNVINATLDVPTLALNFSATPFAYSANKTFIPRSSCMEFGLPSGANSVNLISSTDTTHSVFHGTLNVITGGMYSLFVSGQVAHYDTLFVKDQIPVYPDSAAGVRFINLSSGSQLMSINLKGSTQKEFSSLAFNNITSFKKYSATSSVTNSGGYNFEVRDASNNLLTTFNWRPALFNKSNTLVITGLAGGSVSVFQVNNY
jgi:hypothetical protein